MSENASKPSSRAENIERNTGWPSTLDLSLMLLRIVFLSCSRVTGNTEVTPTRPRKIVNPSSIGAVESGPPLGVAIEELGTDWLVPYVASIVSSEP